MQITPELLFKQIGRKYHNNDFAIKGGEVTSSELSRFQDRLVRNTYARTGLSMDKIEYPLERKKLLEEPSDGDSDRRSSNLRMSLISSRIPIDETKKSWLSKRAFEDSRSILMANENYDHSKWCGHRRTELSLALDFKPDVICFPEFAYPPPASGRTYHESGETTSSIANDDEIKNDYIDRSTYGRNRYKFEEEIKADLKGKSQPFVFLGSYHCPFDFYNMGVIFPLGSDDEKFTTKKRMSTIDDDGEVREYTKFRSIAPPVLYRKRFPARRRMEYTRIPSNFEFHTFNIDDVCIAVMICSDAVDLNQFFNLARINIVENVKEKIDIVLIPSFNQSPKLVSMCRELSFLTRTVVAFVNANEYSSHFPNSEVFVGGFTPTDLSSMGKSSRSVVVFSERIPCSLVKLKGNSYIWNLELNFNFIERFYDREIKLGGVGPLGGSGRSGAVYGPRAR